MNTSARCLHRWLAFVMLVLAAAGSASARQAALPPVQL